MNAENTPIKVKKQILDKLLTAHINVTPNALEFIIQNEHPMKLLDMILTESRGIPSFRSTLSLKTLNKIPNKQIQKILRRVIDKDFLDKQQEHLVDIIASGTHKESSVEKMEKDPKTSFGELEPSLNEEIVEGITKTSKSSISQTDVDTNAPHPNKSQDRDNISEKIKRMTPARSTLDYNPIAKEFDHEYKVKVDPTGKLFTSGEYEDFYKVTMDKFKKLKNLMKKRPETYSSVNINNLFRLQNKTEVSTIGLVFEHRRTKNGHYFFVLEDLTGRINVLVRRDSENRNIINIAEKTIDDQMLFVRGTYSPGNKGGSGIIFANTISKIDVPTEWSSKRSPDPLSIALISDSHIGSKEFDETLWNRFIEFLNGNWGNKHQRELAGKVKYIIINGDLIDGVGVYPSQKEDLLISDIYGQYKKAMELLSEIPDYIKVFYSSGNHEPVRNAVPRPAVPKKYCQDLLNIGVINVGNPCVIQTHNVDSLVYHGDSLLDLNLTVPGLNNEDPAETMKELLICRHLSPLFGNKTQNAPTEQDWMVIEELPEIFHAGHMHINGYDVYRGVHLVNSGCFQKQTDFMKSLGINPTPGILQMIDLDSFNPHTINLNTN